MSDSDKDDETIYGGCEGPEAMYVKLVSSDGHEFIVKREHALTSGTIKAMLSGPGKCLLLGRNPRLGSVQLKPWKTLYLEYVRSKNHNCDPSLRLSLIRKMWLVYICTKGSLLSDNGINHTAVQWSLIILKSHGMLNGKDKSDVIMCAKSTIVPFRTILTPGSFLFAGQFSENETNEINFREIP